MNKVKAVPTPRHDPSAAGGTTQFHWLAGRCLLATLLVAGSAAAQVITIDTRTGSVANTTTGESGNVDRRYQQVKPTHVALPNIELDPKTRLELIRLLQSEQGFAMRPLPRGHKGLKLEANGKLEPAGDGYLSMVIAEGISAKPGDRVVLTDVKVDHSHIVFELNGGPEGKHRFLRHIQLGGTGEMSPIVRDQGQEPMGARLTLAFDKQVPALTGADVKALLSPLISFDVKTPIQAFTDTLPDVLKSAILDHHVMVGMSTEMVLFAKGQPETKYHEMDGNMPFDEWIYGQAPKDVEFVRINGNRVIRVEVAKTGKVPEVFTKDEVEGLMRTDGTPLALNAEPVKEVTKLGDVERNPDTQAPVAPPSLGKADEKLPGAEERGGVMRPVIFPGKKPVPQPGANPDSEPEAQPTDTQATPSPDAGQRGPANPSPGAGQRVPGAPQPKPGEPASQPD